MCIQQVNSCEGPTFYSNIAWHLIINRATNDAQTCREVAACINEEHLSMLTLMFRRRASF